MDQPLCFESKRQERKFCKLKRSIYGLKQASRQWNIKFHHVILNDGFKMMEEDHCMYLKCLNNDFVILSLYVDDILLDENSKDMGEVNYVLEIFKYCKKVVIIKL